MAYGTDPTTSKALVETESDVARHGVVIIRTIETELVPSIMAASRDSLESSPRKLAKLGEDELDDLVQSLRKAATRSTKELTKLYTRVLSKLGNEDLLELERDLEGVDQLFRWPRIAKAAEPVSEMLVERGFSPLELSGPEDVAENLKLELEEKWRPAFSRFSEAVKLAADDLRKQELDSSAIDRKRKKGSRR
jgi:hypothetical protein